MNNQRKIGFLFAAAVVLCANGSAWAAGKNKTLKEAHNTIKSMIRENDELRNTNQLLTVQKQSLQKISKKQFETLEKQKKQINSLKKELQTHRVELKYSQNGRDAVSHENEMLWKKVHAALTPTKG